MDFFISARGSHIIRNNGLNEPLVPLRFRILFICPFMGDLGRYAHNTTITANTHVNRVLLNSVTPSIGNLQSTICNLPSSWIGPVNRKE